MPLPAGPVTRISPLRCMASFSKTGGAFKSDNAGTALFIILTASAGKPFCKYPCTLKLPAQLIRQQKSASVSLTAQEPYCSIKDVIAFSLTAGKFCLFKTPLILNTGTAPAFICTSEAFWRTASFKICSSIFTP